MLQVWIVVPIFMTLVSVVLIFVPLWEAPIPSLAAFAVMACGIPAFVAIVMETPRRYRPKFLDSLSGKWTGLGYIMVQVYTISCSL